jgi:hypothetical protein
MEEKNKMLTLVCLRYQADNQSRHHPELKFAHAAVCRGILTGAAQAERFEKTVSGSAALRMAQTVGTSNEQTELVESPTKGTSLLIEASATVESLLQHECERQVALVRELARRLEDKLRAEAQTKKKLLERLLE